MGVEKLCVFKFTTFISGYCYNLLLWEEPTQDNTIQLLFFFLHRRICMITQLTTHHFMNIYLDLLLFLIWHTFLLQFLTIKMNRKNRSGKKLYENMKNVLPRKNISNMSSSTHNIWNWYCRPPAQSVVASFFSLTYHRALETLLFSKRLFLYTQRFT